MSARDALSKKAIIGAKIKGIFLSFFGWFFACFFGLCFFVGIFLKMEEDKAPGLIFCFVLMVIGIILLIRGTQTTNIVKKCQKYVDIISDQNEANIYDIANTLSQPVNSIITDLQNMISKRFFVGAYLDTDAYKIMFHNQTTNIPTPAVNNSVQQEMNVTTCTGCGAKIRIVKGSADKCEYCGSSITTI